MYQVLASTPMPAVDGHIDATYTDRGGWSQDLGATILPMMVGDETCGPFVVLSYVEPSEEQMPLSFAHAHASDNWRISVRGTTNMGRDTYEQGQFRFHDGGVPYASDNFAWGPDGGYGIIMFADRRGFAIRPVKKEIAEKVVPAQEAAGALLGIDMQDPCPGAPAIATTMGGTTRSHLDGGFDTSDQWDEIAPGVRMAAGIAGEPACGPVLVFLDCAAGGEAVSTHVLGTEVIVAPVAGSVDAAGTTLAQGDVRLEEADVEHPALVAGPDGAQLVLDRRRPAGAQLGPRRRHRRRRPRRRPVERAPEAPRRPDVRRLIGARHGDAAARRRSRPCLSRVAHARPALRRRHQRHHERRRVRGAGDRLRSGRGEPPLHPRLQRPVRAGIDRVQVLVARSAERRHRGPDAHL